MEIGGRWKSTPESLGKKHDRQTSEDNGKIFGGKGYILFLDVTGMNIHMALRA